MTSTKHGRRPARWAALLAAALTLAIGLAPAATGTPGRAGPTLSGVESRPCPRWGERAECGNVRRAWDPTGAVEGKLGVGYVFWPARDTSRPAIGTIVAQEGGPGYASSRSSSSYVELMRPLLERRNLLIVDQRGTGRSDPIDCPELQDLEGSYADAAALCGAELGDHAHLYGTDLAADDLAAVVDKLGVAPVDLYGDSYGTFFAQVFTGRHPDLVRTVMLDAAYPTYGEDAWYDTQAPALDRALTAVCDRSDWCAGDTASSLQQVVDLLRARGPVDGVAPGADGILHRLRLDPPTLAYVAYNGTYAPTTYRELDAGLRSALDGDWLPLLRLLAEADYPGGRVSPPRAYSEGLDAAVSCRDYPQVFDLTAPPEVRREQLAAAVAAKERRDPDVYAPFTVREQVDSEWLTIDWCTGWPVPPADYPPAPPEPPAGSYPEVPVLILSGELDTITTAAEGELVDEQFPNATYVEVANALHVGALGDLDGCVSGIVRDFIRAAAAGDTSCADQLPPIHTAPPFWRDVSDALPATPVAPTPSTSVDALRVATAATATVGDALARWWQSYDSDGLGLRGGQWHARGYRTVHVTLDDYELVGGLPLTGTVEWHRATGRVQAIVTLDGPAGSLQIHWNALDANSPAFVNGTLEGGELRATVLAP